MFLKSIGNFRGLAIIIIVAGHMYSTGFTEDDFLSSIIRNIITGGTSLFVFISGFMFHYVFFKRYDYKKFLTNKFKNVGIPYFILSTLAITISYVLPKGYFEPIEALTLNEISILYADGAMFQPGEGTLSTVIKYFLTGSALVAYWYIPFAILLFATAPLHIKFIKSDLKVQILSITLLSLISIFAHRAVNGQNAIQDLIYFTPVYLIGILVSIHSKKVKDLLENKIIILFLGVLSLSIIQYMTGHQGNYHKPIFEYAGIDLQYIQKLFLIFALYAAFEKYQFESRILDTISNTSFAIFFIHPWITPVVDKVYKVAGVTPTEGENNIFLYCFSVIGVLSLSVFIALLTKKVFRESKNTRYLIGY
ncbi:acyltransferase [Vibrio sp. HN007]|uniref:acyltransferase family protein n=1 Tax=Vibrio iocasae TaxID=3098914 RepID=UPI0035D40896